MAIAQESEQKDLPDGHSIIFSEKLEHFNRRLPLRFYREFIFDCSLSPTRWSIEVILQRGQSGISSFTVIKRKDDTEIEVDMVFMMKAFPITNDVNIPLKSVRRPNIPGMGQVEATFDDFITDEILKQTSTEDLQFEVFFTIQGCHGEKRSFEADGGVPYYYLPAFLTPNEMKRAFRNDGSVTFVHESVDQK